MSEIKDVEGLKSKIKNLISQLKDQLHDNRARKKHKISAYENTLAHIKEHEVENNQVTFEDVKNYLVETKYEKIQIDEKGLFRVIDDKNNVESSKWEDWKIKIQDWKQQDNFVEVQDFEHAARLCRKGELYINFDGDFEKIIWNIEGLLDEFENNKLYKKEK